jgi:predicted metalloprotease
MNESNEKTVDVEDDDMSDLSKLLDLNEEDELLLLQIEVEQEERNIRRVEKRKRKEEKSTKKKVRKTTKNDYTIIQQCLNDLIEKIHLKRTINLLDNHDYSVKKIKIEEKTSN